MASNNKSMLWKVLFAIMLILCSSHMAFGRHIADATPRRSYNENNKESISRALLGSQTDVPRRGNYGGGEPSS
ncbi:hypothetical protein SDJN03_24381, partial [Cucurbita argyrosperma subsp. sororia]